LQVQDMYDLLSCKNACAQRSRLRDKCVVSAVFGKRGWYAPCRGTSEAVAITSAELAESRSTQMHGLFEYRVEHRRQVAGRGIDDLQHLRRRGLLLQGFARLGQQSRILHCNHSLVGKGANQLDLTIGERFDTMTRQANRSHDGALAQK